MISLSMTPAQFEAKAAQLDREEGIALTGSQGVIKKDGVTASWSYDGVTLIVKILSKPMLMTIHYCELKLSAWLAAPASA
jgi:hypothetical protein